jgi:hypothetical protein
VVLQVEERNPHLGDHGQLHRKQDLVQLRLNQEPKGAFFQFLQDLRQVLQPPHKDRKPPTRWYVDHLALKLPVNSEPLPLYKIFQNRVTKYVELLIKIIFTSKLHFFE